MNLHVRNLQAPASSLWRNTSQQLRRGRGPTIVSLFVGSLAVLAFSLWQLQRIAHQNADITALQRGDDAGAAAATGEVQLARVNFLLTRDRYDEAQTVIDAAKPAAPPHVMSRMLYNQANANVRRAFAAIEAGKQDTAIPLTKLAKDAYREALRLDPALWNAKFNYDVAARLIRDFPGYEQDGEEVPPDAAVKLWTDLPGVPQGAP